MWRFKLRWNNISKKSGLNINLNKSLIYFSSNIANRIKQKIGEVTKLTVTMQLGKYLGMSIIKKRVSKDTFGYILDNMRKKLASWKMVSLSFP